MRSTNAIAPSAAIAITFAAVAGTSAPAAKSVATELTEFRPSIMLQSVTAFESFAIAIGEQAFITITELAGFKRLAAAVYYQATCHMTAETYQVAAGAPAVAEWCSATGSS